MISTPAKPATERSLDAGLKAEALRLGFDAVGIAAAGTPETYAEFRRWLNQGAAGSMAYLERQADTRAHPDSILWGVRSLVVVAMVYGDGPKNISHKQENTRSTPRGKIAKYAQGADYHPVLWRRLEALGRWLQTEFPNAAVRAVADTAPLLERDFARLAGLGWFGKNTMLINKRIGSFTVLGALLTDLDLAPDQPFRSDHCGTCTRCLDACPTGALTQPYYLDATRCISHWTIEHRGEIPAPWNEQLHGWLFGCDICQDVCPWNRKAPGASNPELRPRPELVDPPLLDLLNLSDLDLRDLIRGTAIQRAKPAGLRRNAALLLAEHPSPEAKAALTRLAETDPDPAVRAAAAHVLKQYNPAAKPDQETHTT